MLTTNGCWSVARTSQNLSIYKHICTWNSSKITSTQNNRNFQANNLQSFWLQWWPVRFGLPMIMSALEQELRAKACSSVSRHVSLWLLTSRHFLDESGWMMEYEWWNMTQNLWNLPIRLLTWKIGARVQSVVAGFCFFWDMYDDAVTYPLIVFHLWITGLAWWLEIFRTLVSRCW